MKGRKTVVKTRDDLGLVSGVCEFEDNVKE
jgi:hypothetical protein